MQSKTLLALPLALALLTAAAPAFAHEQQTFRIGKDTYVFTVGSLGEPLYVDDKSGVDLRVAKLLPPGQKAPVAADDGDGDDDEVAGTPVTGLENSLKVELMAGDKKKTLDLAPAWSTPGSYSAAFYPTVATGIGYRIFGTLANKPFDVTFTCNPTGHAMAAEDTSEVAVNADVTRIKKTGAFGCPTPKTDAEFPESTPSLRELAASKGSTTGAGTSAAPMGLAAAALALAAVALARTRK